MSQLSNFVLGAMLSGLPGAALADVPGEGFAVAAYELAITPDISNKTLAGREIITLRVTGERVRRLSFTGNALTIDSAMLDGRSIPASQHGETLAFDVPEALEKGRVVKLEVAYHGLPARGFAVSSSSLYTSYFACDWMVCLQNQFGDKAKFALDLRVPAGMDTLSVGNLVSKRPGPDGSEIHRWEAPRPYSAYLFGFAVGHFARAGSRQLVFLSDVAEEAELMRRFSETQGIVEFLATKAGLPLPVSSYSQLLVKGDEAQEAATYSVLGVDSLPTKEGDPEQDWAIVHELSHQWWGNLVTCATLKDFWLNEGIATFMTAAWKEHQYGKSAYDAELGIARKNVEKVRAAGYDKPLAWGGQYPKLGMRRAVQYSKGALFMDHLRSTLGDGVFWLGLKIYTREHAGGTVTSNDLQRAMEKASGKDLQKLFVTWVYGEAPA